MTILLKTSPYGTKACFLHIPKTGGMAVRKILEDNDLVYQEILSATNLLHTSEYTLDTQHNIPLSSSRFMESDFVFAFVRNPITWYQSYWSFKSTLKRWFLHKPIDQKCVSVSFPNFIDNVIYHFPNGYLTEMYHFYTRMCSHVGKQEAMGDGLEYFLHVIGFNEAVVDKEIRVNESKIDYMNIAKYKQYQIPMLINAERAIMEEYGYEIDPKYYATTQFIREKRLSKMRHK